MRDCDFCDKPAYACTGCLPDVEPSEPTNVDRLRVIDAIDKLFSHNEIIALWYDKTEDKDHSYLLWKGEAWRLPQMFQNLALLRFKGIIPENISEADTINIQVPPFIRTRTDILEDSGETRVNKNEGE